MKYLFFSLFFTVTLSSFSQVNRISNLINSLNNSIAIGDDINIIETIKDLKKMLNDLPKTDTLTNLYYDARLVTSYNNLNQYEKTKEIYLNYSNCKICQSDDFYRLYGLILSCAVSAYKNTEDYNLALVINEQLINIYNISNDLLLRQNVLNFRVEKVRLLIALNKLGEAEKEINFVIQISRHNINEYGEQLINALGAKAEMFERKADLNKTLDCFLQIEKVFEENLITSNTVNYLRIKNYFDISSYYSMVSDFESSLVFAKKGVEYQEDNNIKDFTRALGYFQLSKSYWENDSIEYSFNAYQMAINWNEKIYGKNTPFNLLLISGMATLLSKSHFEEAISTATKGINILGNSDEYYAGSESLFETISNVYANPNYAQRNLDSSLNYAFKYRKYILNKLGQNSVEYINSIQQNGNVYFQFQDYENAIPYDLEYHEKIRGVFGTNHYLYRSALNSLAMSYQSIGKTKEAEKYRLELSVCWNRYIKDNYVSLVGNIQNNLGIIEAIDYSFYFLENNKDVLNIEESFIAPYENLLLVKNLQLSSFKSIQQEFTDNSELSSKLESYLQLKNSRNKLDENLKISELESELLSNSRMFKEIQNGQQINFKRIKESLSLGQVFIDFTRIFDPIENDNSYFAVIFNRNSKIPIFIKCGLEKKIINCISRRDMFGLYTELWLHIEKVLPEGTTELILSPIYELNNLSFASVCDNKGVTKKMDENQSKRGVVIGSNGTEYSCSYLIDKFKITYVQSARSLIKINSNLSPISSLLAIGGVDYNNLNLPKTNKKDNIGVSQVLNEELFETLEVMRKSLSIKDFGYLPYTEIEVNQIAKLCKGKFWRVELMKSKEADEFNLTKALSKNSFEILHFATHGFSYPEFTSLEKTSFSFQKDPLNRCGLILAGANKSWSSQENSELMIKEYGNDGILTGNEVLKLPISKTKLVVLSACETSIGKIEGMESSLSLNRMFLMSGVEYVISSLWSVPDKETMELMTIFYLDLTKTLNLVISFEKAQKEMRNKYPTEPEKWAGFVLVR